MRKRIFLDASYLVARISKRDRYHSAAVLTGREFDSVQYFTIDLVLVEMLNFFSWKERHLREVAGAVAADMLRSADVFVERVDDQLFHQALKLYLMTKDKNWSFVDCASFQLMKKFDITEAFTFDAHFRQAGFRTYPTNV